MLLILPHLISAATMFISSPRLCKQWKLSSGENVDVAHINLINVLTADGGFSFKQTIWRGFFCGVLPLPSPDGSQRVWGPSKSENHVKNKTSFSNPKEAALNDQVHGFLRHTFRWISKTCKRGGEAIWILRGFTSSEGVLVGKVVDDEKAGIVTNGGGGENETSEMFQLE
jgi:hypothetical protein